MAGDTFPRRVVTIPDRKKVTASSWSIERDVCHVMSLETACMSRDITGSPCGPYQEVSALRDDVHVSREFVIIQRLSKVT